MKNDIQLLVPAQLQSDYFYKEHQLQVNLATIARLEYFKINNYFLYELVYYAGMDGLRPWEHAEQLVPQLFTEWKKVYPELAAMFEKRQLKKVADPMKHGISLFIQSLFWTNSLPVCLNEDFVQMDELKWKPVNVTERVTFILQRPNYFHSFVQLTELMAELEKQFHTKKASKR